MSNRWYTGAGDDGYTGILGPERVPKYAARLEALGSVDEASADLGLARAQARDSRLPDLLVTVQRDLYRLMADLATPPGVTTRPSRLEAERVAWLEQVIADMGRQVEMPPGFIVPGDSLSGATLEVARTVVRRAERLVARLVHAGELQDNTPLKYLNRLSSLLFILARLEDKAAGVQTPTLAAES